MKVKKQKEIPKNEFRKNKTNGHPAYIYARVGNEYKLIGITHSAITQSTKNIKLDKNPNPKDKRCAYVKPYSEKEKTNKLKKKYVGWQFSITDKLKINKLKNKKRTK